MDFDHGETSESEELVIALTPLQLGAVLAALVVVFVIMRARKAC